MPIDLYLSLPQLLVVKEQKSLDPKSLSHVDGVERAKNLVHAAVPLKQESVLF